MRHGTLYVALAFILLTCLPVLATAEGKPVAIPRHAFPVGAGYERYVADWRSDTWPIRRGQIEQNRLYIYGSYLLAGRFEIGGRLGTAHTTTSDLVGDFLHPHESIDYGFEGFAALALRGTAFGALPGQAGVAFDMLLEISAFLPSVTEVDSYVYDMEGDKITMIAQHEIREFWEGSLAALLRVGSERVGYGMGPVVCRSGAMRTVRLRVKGFEETYAEYIKADQESGMVFTLRLTLPKATILSARILLGPTTRIGIQVTKTLV